MRALPVVWSRVVVAWLAALATLGCSSEDEPTLQIDLRADVNRNGRVDLGDPTEDADEESWDDSHGAIFLPNLDDDELACPREPALSDAELASCHDAADEVVNGENDLLDLARLEIAAWPDAPDTATATIELSSPGAQFVRLFRNDGESYVLYAQGAPLSAEELRSGVELAIEGRDVVRDQELWDGFVDVTLRVVEHEGGAALIDTVRMRQAPVLISHHLQPAQQVMATVLEGVSGSSEFREDLRAAITAAGVPHGLVELPAYEGDQWTQDHFEAGWVSMPAASGPQVIVVFLRAPNVWHPENADSPLREAGRVVFEIFRGADIGGVQQYDIDTPEELENLSSLGNLEAIPPHSHEEASFPFGRMLIGSTDSFPMDPSFVALLEAQSLQPLLKLDTSWLFTGHVDEIVTFVPVDSPRGWALVVNDPRLARTMLEDAAARGYGDVAMFEGKRWADEIRDGPAEVAVSEVLADPNVMAASAAAAVEVDAQLDVLREATGITDEEIIRAAFLHTNVFGKSLAYQPSTVNGIVLSDTDFAAPDPHGPTIEGRDIFREQLIEAFGEHGITVHFVEDWTVYHRFNGEVHCGSNALRALPPEPPWWESGR